MRTSARLRLLASAALILTLLMLSSSATTYQVDSNLQAAINSAEPGDTLRVSSGNYGPVVVTKSLNLIGEDAQIRPLDHQIGIKVQADNVTISGFTVKGGLYGIHLVEARGCTVSDNTVTGCGQWGIGLIFSDQNLVANNLASFNGLGGEGWYGIYLSNSDRNIISGNTASDNGEYGVCLFPSCNENRVVGNVMERNDYGIYMFRDCSENLIQANRLSHNRNSGLKMMHDCVSNRILSNTITKNDVVGIFLDSGSGKNLVQGNEIADNSGTTGASFGIQIQEGSENNTILENNVSGSQKGIFVSTDGNHVYKNRIFENVIQAEDRGTNRWWQDYPAGGNFWGDYRGQDLMSGPGQNLSGSDGFGDAPYWIDAEGKVRDVYPVMGESTFPLELSDWRITPARVLIGEPVKVRATFDAKYGVAQVSARAHNVLESSVPNRYIRMERFGDQTYEGALQTAIMEAGRYEIVLTARDIRGNEIEERVGEVELLPRSGWDFDADLSQRI